MSQVLPKMAADELAYAFQPKKLETDISVAAKDFVEREKLHVGGFQISEIVSEQSRVDEIRRKNIDIKVEETVLERVKEIEEQAYAEAYKLGLEEGADKAFKENNDLLKARLSQFDSVLQELDQIKLNIFKQNEVQFISLIFAIAEKIAMHSIQADPGPIAQTLNSLVESMHNDDQIVIQLSKSDYDFIEALRQRKVKDVPALQNVRLVEAEGFRPTEFVIESNHGMIEASLKTRVEKVWDALKSRLPLLHAQKTYLKGKNESGDQS
jgi:flagellar assembly protein FliH